MKTPYMILSAFFFNPQGDHRMSWRHPRAPSHEVFDFAYYRRLVEAAEQARIDAIFVADHVAIWDSYDSNVAHYANARLEPLSLLSALASVTTQIGLIGTASTSYSEPYNLARFFASLDHISHGRAAWNVVTSSMTEEAMNFGRDGNLEHATRYARASEFLDVAKALWDSWEDNAILIDKDTGHFANPALVHRLNHSGVNFRVRGPLNVPRPPQGHPLIVQAGSSEDGKNLAAAHADIHFAIVKDVTEARGYRRDIHSRLAHKGRTPEAMKILPGILPIVAESRDSASERQDLLESFVPVKIGLDLLSSWAGVDLSGLPLDGPLPTLPEEANYDGGRTALARVRAFAEKGLTIREVIHLTTNTGTAPIFAGTASDVADQMEAWFKEEAADGFNLMFPLLPEDWTNFMDLVIPELQRRGLARTEYSGASLRERLGIPRPPNLFAG